MQYYHRWFALSMPFFAFFAKYFSFSAKEIAFTYCKILLYELL